ncbi:Swi five-dependent recombination repair protein Sfr1 [Bulinus truncatus]|nr:Swi five-dependent recombination repair protein Sfr1 [Bulinus truncatus]
MSENEQTSSAENPLQLSSALKERLKKKCGKGRIHAVCQTTDEKSSQFSDKIGSNKLSQESLSKRSPASNIFGTVALKKRRLEYDETSEQKTSCFDDSNEKEVQDKSGLSSEESSAKHVSVAHNVKDSLLKEKKHLESILKEKSETLRKLKMVKMYREKNNLEELQVLINTWREVSQFALVDLHNLLPDPRPTLSELVSNMNIDTNLIQYNVDEECFS